jgi:hypothetical protein
MNYSFYTKQNKYKYLLHFYTIFTIIINNFNDGNDMIDLIIHNEFDKT